MKEIEEIDHGVCFVIIDRGFIYIGEFKTNNQFATINNPINVRSYTAGKGLLWHVDNGDEDMELDKGGKVIKVPFDKVIHFIPTDKSLWYK